MEEVCKTKAILIIRQHKGKTRGKEDGEQCCDSNTNYKGVPTILLIVFQY